MIPILPKERKKNRCQPEINSFYCLLGRVQCTSGTNDSSPTDQPPVLLDSSGQRNLLSLSGTSRRGQLKLSNIGLGGDDLGSSGGGSNVNHENLVLSQLSNLSLLSVGGLDSEKTSKKEEVDLEVSVDAGKLSLDSKDVTDETIGTAESGVDTGSNS